MPSFSSKGFPDVAKIIEYSSEIIEGPMLISAYDLHYREIARSFDFANLLFLDSGGYEASKDADLSDFGERDHVPRKWTLEMYENQLAKWRPGVPSVIISYDHPTARIPIRAQIRRAKKMGQGRADLMREILLKPETGAQNFLQIDNVVAAIRGLAAFDAIGVTEKEIGNSILTRMQNIAKLRKALMRAGINLPIYVFGSLDPVTTPLYFLAGADIFDGLTWLRFAFHDGQTLYKQNYGALHLGVKTAAHVIDGRCWNCNYYYMTELELQMRRFLNDGDFNSFKFHGDHFRSALEIVKEAIGD